MSDANTVNPYKLFNAIFCLKGLVERYVVENQLDFQILRLSGFSGLGPQRHVVIGQKAGVRGQGVVGEN